MPSHLPYVGISTFFKAPFVAEPPRDVADVAVLGVPYDEATTARSGARMGPRALRDASLMWAYQRGGEPFFDGETGSHILAGVRWADCDDVEIPPTAPDGIRIDRIAGPVARLVSAGLFPVVLGGDHSVTYPVLKGVFASRGDRPVNLVQFDSHIDYWDEEGGQRYTHASPIIRATRTRPGHRPRHRHTGAGGLHLLRGRG